MFGSTPGEERRFGAMNQYLVTKATARKRVYWIFHTKGEDPVSVLIQDLNKQIVAKAMTQDMVMRLISSISTTVTIRELSDYNRVCDTLVFNWGDAKEATLDALVKVAKTSSVLAYEKLDVVGEEE